MLTPQGQNQKASSHLEERQESRIPRAAAPSGNSVLAHHELEQPVPIRALLCCIPAPAPCEICWVFILSLWENWLEYLELARQGWGGMGQLWDGSWRLWVLLKFSATLPASEQSKTSGEDGNMSHGWRGCGDGGIWGNLGRMDILPAALPGDGGSTKHGHAPSCDPTGKQNRTRGSQHPEFQPPAPGSSRSCSPLQGTRSFQRLTKKSSLCLLPRGEVLAGHIPSGTAG